MGFLQVVACKECLRDGTERCEVCRDGYKLNDDGSCSLAGWWLAGYIVLCIGLCLNPIFQHYVGDPLVELQCAEAPNLLMGRQPGTTAQAGDSKIFAEGIEVEMEMHLVNVN